MVDEEQYNAQMNNTKQFLSAIGMVLPNYLSDVSTQLNNAKNQASTLTDATLDENKKITQYDYFEGIKTEFSKIYGNINKENILEAFVKGNKNVTEIKSLEKSIIDKDTSKDKKKEDAFTLLNTLGFDPSKLDFKDPSMFAKDLLTQGTTRLLQSSALNDKINDLYFKELNSIKNGILEYVKISTKLKDITDLDLYNFTVQNLYLKTYEVNKKILVDVYKQDTSKSPKDFKDYKAYMEDLRKHMTSKHPILIEKMDNDLRVGIAHSIYKNLDGYPSNIILDMARRNFITAVIGVVTKTDSIVNMFENNSKMISSILKGKDPTGSSTD